MATNKHRGTCIISIGGKKRGLVFNMNTYAIFCDGLDINLTEMDKVFSDRRQAKALCWLLYSGCVAYDEKNNKDVDYNIHDFYDWAMELSSEDTNKVMETMMASQNLGNDSNNGMSRNIVKSTKDDLKKN
jgi:hypothetical protein|tara:strand:+ start:183 stop:572 length:390 start_codon:yes stop_codon:yes gene_type:complete